MTSVKLLLITLILNPNWLMAIESSGRVKNSNVDLSIEEKFTENMFRMGIEEWAKEIHKLKVNPSASIETHAVHAIIPYLINSPEIGKLVDQRAQGWSVYFLMRKLNVPKEVALALGKKTKRLSCLAFGSIPLHKLPLSDEYIKTAFLLANSQREDCRYSDFVVFAEQLGKARKDKTIEEPDGIEIVPARNVNKSRRLVR